MFVLNFLADQGNLFAFSLLRGYFVKTEERLLSHRFLRLWTFQKEIIRDEFDFRGENLNEFIEINHSEISKPSFEQIIQEYSHLLCSIKNYRFLNKCPEKFDMASFEKTISSYRQNKLKDHEKELSTYFQKSKIEPERESNFETNFEIFKKDRFTIRLLFIKKTRSHESYR